MEERDPPLYDPYQVPQPPVEPPSEPLRRPANRGLRALVIAFGACTLLLGSVTLYLIGKLNEQPASEVAKAAPGAQRSAGKDKTATTEPSGHPPNPPGSSVAPAAQPRPDQGAPDDTKESRVGGIAVVDLGISTGALKRALQEQLRKAKRAGQRPLFMITGRRCDPCRGVDRSLSEPQMQQALRGVRLIRIDLRVFQQELLALQLPATLYPAFLLLDDAIRPKDGIHGGEWGEDIAANIAPVIDAFLRGTYRRRKHPRWVFSGRGVRL